MICPHCKADIKYRERGGKKCSQCRQEFAFEPKTDPLGLHDARFVKAADRISDYGKIYFTPTQLYYFLARKKLTNSTNSLLGTIFFGAFLGTILSIILSFAFSSTGFLLLGLLGWIGAGILSFIFWNRQGDLTVPQVAMERDVLNRWSHIYSSLPPQLIKNSQALPLSNPLPTVRGALVCDIDEILTCLAANKVNEQLGLMFLNSSRGLNAADKSRLEFIRQNRDLPVFVLHDASADGCQLKQNFLRKHLGNDQRRKVFDIGLRPRTVMSVPKLLKLRWKNNASDLPQYENLTPEETKWLNTGNYTPLLSLTPAQLIKYVTAAVQKNLSKESSGGGQPVNPQQEAQSVGFMTWVGQSK